MPTWSTAKPKTGNDNSQRLDQLVDIFEFPKNEWVRARPMGPITSYYGFWIAIKTKKGKRTVVFKLCLDYDPETEEFKTDKCPYRKAAESGKYDYTVKLQNREQKVIRAEKKYLGNFLIREEQENEPKKKAKWSKSEKKQTTILGHSAYWKDPESKSWTPVKVIRVPNTLANKLKDLTELNKHTIKGEKKVFDLSHPKRGMDVNLKFDPDASGTAMYDAQKDEQTKLSEEEQEYLLHDISVMQPQESEDDAKSEWKKLKNMIIPEEDNGEEGKKKGKKKKGAAEDLDDDDSDLEDDDLDDLDDDDLDDIDDDDDEDEDEDEKPKKKKSSSKSSKSSKSGKSDKSGKSSKSSKSSSNKSGSKKPSKSDSKDKSSKSSKSGKSSKSSKSKKSKK